MVNKVQASGLVQADRLVAKFVQCWLDAEADPIGWSADPFEFFIETAAEAVARGLDPDSLGEESYERRQDEHYGDRPEAPWGQVEEDRQERAWSYVGMGIAQVVSLLGERGHRLDTHGLPV
ncbi:hypothetical protein GALL_297460 [mine drainage metagenome]|uniref:Uncharacterized protein n=1 Tax=mine drainage metagenome TaxID=410659 RepID=A0A1J5QXF7_9ZZZZ